MVERPAVRRVIARRKCLTPEAQEGAISYPFAADIIVQDGMSQRPDLSMGRNSFVIGRVLSFVRRVGFGCTGQCYSGLHPRHRPSHVELVPISHDLGRAPTSPQPSTAKGARAQARTGHLDGVVRAARGSPWQARAC